MNKQENNKQTENSNELYTVLPVVLNVFLVDTSSRLLAIATKERVLNQEQKEFIKKEYGKINYINNGSTGFTGTVIYI